MAKAVRKKRLAYKEAGRPAGSANKTSGYPREYISKIRCSEGFKETIRILKDLDPKKSEADIIHEALQLFAIRKVSNNKDLYYVNRIL